MESVQYGLGFVAALNKDRFPVGEQRVPVLELLAH